MPAAYSLRCPACGSDFLATHTRMDAVTACPHCARLGPLQTFTATGATPLGSAPALALRRREVLPPTGPPVIVPAAPPPASEAIPSAPATPVSASHRRGPASPAFLPLDDVPAEPCFVPASKRGLGPLQVALTFLALMILVGFGWLINQPNPPDQSAAALPELRPEPPSNAAQAGTPPPALPPAPHLPPAAEPAINVSKALEEARLNSEVPEVMRLLFDGPAQERMLHVHGGDLHADSLAAFFSRAEPVLPGGLRRLPVNPLDLVSGQAVALFQATSSTNRRGALTRFHQDPTGKLRLDWGLFQETHDTTLERFLESGADQPQWFHLGIRRSHGLDLPPGFRESHHVFDLQTEPANLLSLQGTVARDLPLGRYLNQRMDWQAIYLARLLLLKKALPGGGRALEILDCEGAGLSRPSTSAPAPPETVPLSTLPGSTR